MIKKYALAAATAAVATGGIMSAAQAGELKLALRNVNVYQESPSEVEHIDEDNGPDLNGATGPQGADSGFPTGLRSIDKGFINKVTDIDGTLVNTSHVAVARERMANEGDLVVNGTSFDGVGGRYEVDVFEITGGATFNGAVRFDIRLTGSANPVFKENVNCVNALRAGSDNIHSQSAATAASGVPIRAGNTEANCNVFVTESGGLNGEGEPIRADRAIGWWLPILSQDCGDLIVEMDVTRIDPFEGPSTVTISHLIQTCKDSIKVDVNADGTKVDYYTDFKTFLTVGDHEPTLWDDIGEIGVMFHQNLVDLKAEDPKENAEAIFEISDVEGAQLVLQFDDLQGIESVEIRDADDDEFRVARRIAGADYFLDSDTNTAVFNFDHDDLLDIFGLETVLNEDDEFVKGGKSGATFDPDTGFAVVSIHAFNVGDKVSLGVGAIDHQIITVSSFQFFLTPNSCIPAHCAKFTDPDPFSFDPLGAIAKTGINFGPMDWVTDAGSVVASYFRVTGIPEFDAHGEPIDLKGSIEVENASDGPEFDGVFKVDYDDDDISNGELLLDPGDVRDLLIDAGMPDAADWGRGDLTFTFYVGKEGLKMDLDRLMVTNGVFAPYGDNSNDSTSLKARSCDDGRFGPHVANKLKDGFTAALTAICGLGEISRGDLFLQ